MMLITMSYRLKMQINAKLQKWCKNESAKKNKEMCTYKLNIANVMAIASRLSFVIASLDNLLGVSLFPLDDVGTIATVMAIKNGSD